MVARTASLNEEDIWHVQVADGDVRIVTLDQLDDLFRLDLIDDNVNVWQPGMPTWQPLKVVAGMDEEELKQVPLASRPPPPPPKRAPAPAAAPVSRPPSWAAPSAFAATLPAPSSFSPLATSSRSSALPYGKRRSSFGTIALTLIAFAGVSVTVYRNGLARDAAVAIHQEALYRRAEAALGPPGFGTLSSVERMTVAAAPAAADSAALTPSSSTAAAPAPIAASPSATSTALTATPSGTPSAPSAPTPANTAAAASAPVSLDTLPREGSATASKPSAPVAAGSAAKPGKTGKGLSSGLKGSSSAYDPLNGKL